MAVSLELIQVGAKMIGTVLRDNDKQVWKDTFNPDTQRGRKSLLKTIGGDDERLLGWIDEARKAGRPTLFVIEAEAALPSAPMGRVRSIEQTAATATEHDLTDPARFVKTVIRATPVDQIAEWDGKDRLCCLDIDYHDRLAPSKDTLSTLVLTRVAPRPLAWHFSRGGGLHLFYVAVDPYTAEELAAIAALRFRASDPTAGLELKAVVRGPGDAEWHEASEQSAAGEFVAWLGSPEYDTDERDEWLERHGLNIEQRYDHDRCPINPTPGYASKGSPVTVSEAGIFCHKCAGEGRSFGSRKAGFSPWSAILGSPSAGDLGTLVRNVIHWGHAKWVLTEKYGMPISLARLAYSAALKAMHTGGAKEPLLHGVWNFHTDDMARVGDQWVSVTAAFDYPKDIKNLIATLPACQFVNGEGNVVVDRAAVDEMSCPKSLLRYGYSGIKIVHGFRMASTFLADRADTTTVAVVNPRLLERGNKFIPRYVPRAQRMKEEKAWATIETVAPGIDRTLVKVAICGFACAQETQAGLLPMVFVTGATGTAKTSTLKFAGGIYGAQTGDVIFESDPAKFRQSVRSGARTGPAILFNEVLKDSARGRSALTPKEALDPLLNMTPDSQSWVAYMGPLKMGRPPAFFLTEPVCPLDLRDEAQLARRIRHYRLHGTKSTWPKTISDAGLGQQLDMLRTVSPAMNEACDAILSYVCDEWFSMPHTWDAMADAMGVNTILDSPDFKDMTPWHREFFRLVCLAPAPEGQHGKVHTGGFKRISRTDSAEQNSIADHLLTVYGMFADGTRSADWVQSRRLEEKDWAQVLGTDQHVWFDRQTDGAAVYVRFRVGPTKKPTAINEQIVKPEWAALL